MRRLLLLLASLLHLSGAALLLQLPIPAGLRALMLAAWAGECARDWRKQLRAYRRVAAIRVRDSGQLEAVAPGGQLEALCVLDGSIVLPRLAWLRLAFADRSRYGELLVPDARHGAAWHRLQLAWRQHGARFGQPDRS